MSSIALVIFLMDCVDRIRRRSTRICAAIGLPSALRRGRLVDLDRLLVDLVLVQRLGLGLLRHHRGAVGGGEALLELLDASLSRSSLLVGELAGVADLGEDALVVAPQVVQELRSKRRTSSTGTESSWPVVPRQIETTCSSTGYGAYWACLSSSTRRSPRSSAAAEAASRSEPKAANASSSRYCDRSSRSEPDTWRIALIWAAPPTRDTEMPTLIAGRTPWLNRSDSRKTWPSVIEMTLVGM